MTLYLVGGLIAVLLAHTWLGAVWWWKQRRWRQRRRSQDIQQLIDYGVKRLVAEIQKAERAIPRSAPPLGALLQFGDDGLPLRLSVHERSPYFYPLSRARITVDGSDVQRCVELDRLHGWVQCEDEDGKPLPRIFGSVTLEVV